MRQKGKQLLDAKYKQKSLLRSLSLPFQLPACGRCASKGFHCQPRTSQYASDAVIQAKRQLEAHKRKPNEIAKLHSRTSTSLKRSSTVKTQQAAEVIADVGQSPSRPTLSEATSSSSPAQRRPGDDAPGCGGDPSTELSSTQQYALNYPWTNDMASVFDQNLQQGGLRFQYPKLFSDASGNPVESLGDDMQPSVDFNLVDVLSFVAPDSANTDIFDTQILPSAEIASEALTFPPITGKESPQPKGDGSDVIQQGWPCFRCNPVSNAIVSPKAGRAYLEALEFTLKNHDAWTAWTTRIFQNHTSSAILDSGISIKPFSDNARDKLMVIAQYFLWEARDVHGSSPAGNTGSHDREPTKNVYASESFITIPSSDILQYFLRAYTNRFEHYYPCLPASKLDPTELLESGNEKTSGLLILLMIAQGAMSSPLVEAQRLALGLTEACRISMLKLHERDVSLASDTCTLRSALMWVTLAAYSGIKWHMDVGAFPVGIFPLLTG